MPLYEYECDSHGVFELQRPLQQASAPAPCPECCAAAPRILSASHVTSLARSEVKARDRNEKNRHEPRLAQRAAPPADPAQIKPISSHGRPWAIGH